jgi:hypothetical protein
MTDKQKEVKKDVAAVAEPQKTVIRWDDSKMSSSYANVCNVSSTREEVTVLFGTNQAWHTGQKELTVQLSDRVVLNPYAAKRLSLLLSNVMGEYEKRFGKLEIDVPEK